jgi:hypothetical protein
MTARHIGLAGFFVASILCLSGCSNIMNQLGFVSPDQIEAARARLNDAESHLPTLPGVVILDSVEHIESGQMEECASYHLSQLIGTNEMTFPQVLDTFTSLLESSGWKLTFSVSYGRDFASDKKVGLEVSDNYKFVPISPTAISTGEGKFRTLLLIDLGTPIVIPVPKHCEGG